MRTPPPDGHASPGGRLRLGWAPRIGTQSALLVAVLFAAFVFSPLFWAELGADAKDFYAVGTLSAQGGDPYSATALFAAEDAIYNRPRHLSPGAPGYFAPNAYAYPPLFTRVLELGARLPRDAFPLVTLAIVLVAGVSGIEMVLAGLGWEGRWLPRAFFLVSSPMVLAVFVGNPSPLLLAAWGAAFLLMTRGRTAWGGAVLSLSLLKLPVGLPVAIALLATGPIPAEGRRWRQHALAAGGFAAGAAALLALNVLAARPGAMTAWLRSLTAYQGALGNQGNPGLRQSGLAGLPALFLGVAPAPLAVGLAALPVLGLLLWAQRHRAAKPTSRHGLLGLATAAALVLCPYLHVNDLVLEALPVTVMAAASPTGLTRLALLATALFIPISLVFTAILVITTPGHRVSEAGLGVALTALVLVAQVSLRRRGAEHL